MVVMVMSLGRSPLHTYLRRARDDVVAATKPPFPHAPMEGLGDVDLP